MESQTPSLPDPSTLKDLPPSVAITFLIVTVVIALLVYFGQPLRERLKRRGDTDERPARQPSPALPAAPAPAAAVDVAERRTDQFIDNLLRQIEAGDAENTRLERRIDELERQLGFVRDEKAQLLLENHQLRMQVTWQRGTHQ